MELGHKTILWARPSCGRGFQKAKVFKLESVDHREPSQKLKFIEITVFGLLVVVFFFFCRGWGMCFVLATV